MDVHVFVLKTPIATTQDGQWSSWVSQRDKGFAHCCHLLKEKVKIKKKDKKKKRKINFNLSEKKLALLRRPRVIFKRSFFHKRWEFNFYSKYWLYILLIHTSLFPLSVCVFGFGLRYPRKLTRKRVSSGAKMLLFSPPKQRYQF